MNDIEYLTKRHEEMKSMPLMNSYFVRVYHMKDGSVLEWNRVHHNSYKNARENLWVFHPTQEQGANDIDNVSYITIEERFTPCKLD